MKFKKLIRKIISKVTGWEKIDYLPRWINLGRYGFDGGNYYFQVKGKNYIYKIRIYNWKCYCQKIKVWRKLRKIIK